MNLKMDESFILDLIQELGLTSTHEALDFMYETFNKFYIAGEFDFINSVLTKLDIQNYSDSVLCGFLSITFTTKDKLPFRAELMNSIHAKYEASYGRERADRILMGLG